MGVTLWISKRLRLSGASGERRAAGAVIAVAGVALAVMVMEITLAVVAGFKTQISDKIMGFDAQISIDCPYDYATGVQSDTLNLSSSIESVISSSLPSDSRASLALHLPAMIKTDDDFAAVVFIAHDDTHSFDFELSNIVDGKFPQSADDEGVNQIALSSITASSLNLEVGDKPYLYFFVDGSLKARRAVVTGIYDSNLGEYDKMVAYAPLSFLQNVLGVSDFTGTTIDITGLQFDEIDDFASELQINLADAMQTGQLDALYPVSTVLQSGAIYFNWLSLLDTNVIVIFVLMLCVALFTLVSSLYLIVLDRVPTIGLLKSLGASRRWLISLFVSLGMRLAVIGVLCGNIIGIGICILQAQTGFVKLDPAMYYLSQVPVEIDCLSFVLLNLGVLFVSYLILFIPARSAARVDPTESIRFE